MSCQIPNNIEGVDADGICEITFHVHMPNKFDRSLQPVVLGSVRELGNWSCPVVKLRQNDTNSTYWFSDPVKICIKDHSIHYKYALYQPIKEKQDMFDIIRDKVLGDRTIVMEGNSDNDNRLLSYRGFQYDVWKDNYYKKLYSPDLTKDYKFVYVVYESVTLENIKEKIKEFQALLKYQPSLTADAVDITLIRNLVASSREDYQRIFICFLLAFYINVTQERMEHHTRVRLPENFPSINLLQALEKIRSEDIPSDARILFTLATSALVRHNSSKRNVFDWMKMFAIAPVVDPSYTFLVNIEKHNYDQRNQVLNFYNLLKRNVKPYLDRIEDRPQTYQTAIEKIIEISFFDMESCDFLVREMIGKERMNERIKRSIDKFISQYIDSDDPRNLERHFKSLSEDLRVECAPVFCEQFSKLLSNNRISWKSEYLESMFHLFSQLFTAELDIMKVLVLLSKSRNVDLLLSFPKWSKFALESRNVKADFRTKISTLCEEWYSTIMSAVTNQKNTANPVIFLYQQLSAISFVLQRRTDIYKKLVDTVEQKILNFPQEWSFKATSFVGALESRIVGDFEKVLRQRLKSPLSIDTNDNAVIKIISQICNSSGSPLYVPNRLCENVLCHILDKIRNKAVVSKIHNASNDHLQLLHFKSSKLWIFILNATGEVNELLNHPHVESVRSKISQLVCAIEDQSITIGMLNTLVEFPNDILTGYFNAGIGTKKKKIANEMLDSLREQLREHSNTVEKLFSFYNRWCNKAEDTLAYLDDLTEKVNNLNNTPFLELVNPHYWSIHNEIIEVSRRAYQYENSQTFANVFEIDTNEEVQKSVLLVSQVFGDSLLERYQRICIEYKSWKHIKCSEARPLWNGITSEQVKHELDLMAGDATWYRQRQTQNDLLRSIEYLAQFPSSIKQLKNLSDVLTQFNIKNKEKSWAIEMLNTLENTDMILGDLQDFFKKYNKKYGAYRECWSLIKELSFAKEFIDFLLKELIGRDLTNLINAVDDQSDTKLLQENTVATLIEVNEALTPLSKELPRSSIDSFLNCLSEVSKKHSSLALKIGYCSSHNLTLQNMYRNISNRGDVTKERIKKVATIGLYTFQHVERTNLCEVVLTYGTTQNHEDTNSTPRIVASYNLADLYNLYGRALLIGKSRASTNRSSGKNDSQDINTFIVQVNLVRQIIEVASKLIRLRHFLYQKMKIEARGVSELQCVLNKLARDLKTWEDMVDRAQNKHYYLTFFSALDILAFYKYFRTNNHERDVDKLKEVCQNILRFVNDAAQLPTPMEKWNAVQNEDDIFSVLCNIGAILYDIFNDIPQQVRSIPDTLKPVIADTVFRGQIFVAACRSHSLVPNVILSLFANHQSFPKPWQILICQSTTTAEEITLFIKRSFIATDNEYKDYLFCIANVEFLNFELQDILVRAIYNFKEKKNDYLLALVCTLEYGRSNHILDQFAENVHVTNGLDAESMELLYQEICSDVICVTSKMSGQGKTEWIKEFSFQRDKVPRTLLISDGAHFGILVRQLADCKISAVESLHLDIRLITHPYEVNFFLFELLTFKVVSNGSDIVHLTDTLIFVEIASTTKHYLLDSLPIIKYLRRQDLEWNMDNLMVSQHVNSPVQIVSRYLDLYSRKIIDKENIRFTGDNAIDEPLPAERCRQLLQRYFFDGQKDDIHSYRFLKIFINVLADQLVRFSASPFFEIEQLRIMMQETNIRSSLLEILITCSKEFATRAINTKTKQEENTRVIQEGDTQDIDSVRLGNITQWNDSNHLIVLFLSQIPDSICALYREKNKVPNNVENLLKSQVGKLQDYYLMEPSLLLERLGQLVRQKMHKLDGLPKYALSIENLLKMAMILLRSRANIPVVCCGEAGCGKTSLISFLSMVMEVNFIALDLHAGIHEDDIQNFMNEATELAQKGETWVFFDAINTCDHIGMFGNLIAHRLLNGRLIHPNIRIFAACNPYRLRIKAQSNVGLSAILYEEKCMLAYRVHPMTDQILDYVWDYGCLKAEDERNYIDIMVKTQLGHQYFAELLCASQEFIRKVEEPFSVSLRDVKRAIKLYKFFSDSSKNRKSKYDTKTRSLVLALGVCYLFRLHDQLQRKNYRMKMIEIIKNHQPNFKTSPNTRNDAFEIIIRNEQDEYINHMKNYPDGTAWNEALLENILVMIVCIQTRIPVFIIGAPGSSKSLAVRIISMNLRGIDSKDPYFRTLPQVYMIPHQGSSSSTSEGIEKVFQSAQNYQETSSKENPVTSVVLLDEVGLAETSPHNPLKVLHALLEPPLGSKDDVPAVSVIGISNWRLDNSKSSRALLVQRPLFAENDLIDTAKRLLDGTKRFDNINLFLKKLADSYLRYIKNQRFANFHGLRDYYFLIKSIRSMGKKDRKPNVQLALARNFGGADNMEELCTIYFQNVLKPAHVSKFNYTPIPVQELINANLAEKDARNLMLIGNGNSIVTFQTYQLRQQNIEPVVIIGSQFPDDKDGGEYSYATLNRIMMCVETGRCLILTDLEVIYGSLYDLFNQNFITDENSGDKGDSGDENSQRNYTRISLGPYSNPMLYVHPNFRCILVLDEAKLPLADPPLLNRFEKQKLTLEETLTERQAMIFNRLKEWTSQISSIYESGDEDAKSHFKEKDMFIGFTSEETLQSLIIDRCGKNADSDDDTIVLLCKESLISIATSDGIVRADKSLLKAIDASEVQKWQDVYFQNQQHGGIQEFYRAQPKDNLISHLTIINTFSNINTDIKLLLKGIMSCQVDKLSTFKSEAELQNQIKRFYESEHDLYILQCDLSTVNAGCIRLAKFIIEQYQNESVNKEYQQIKNVCIILHFSRNFDKDSANLFNFMCGWNQMTIENLTTSENSLSLFLHSTISEILNEQLLFEKILSQELLWCLLCMKHPSSKKSVDHIRELIRDIPKSARLVECLKLRTEEWLQANSSDQWHLDVALDQKSLTLHSSFSVALETHVRALIRKPIAKLLYILERNHSITLLFSWDNNADESDENELFKFWKEIFINKKIVNIDDMVMDPRPDLYSTSGNYLNLKFPFSYYFMEQIDQYKKLYFEELDLIYENPENLGEDGNLRPEVKDEFLEKFSEGIRTTLTALTPAILELARSLYVEDFITVSSTNAGYSKESDIKLLYILFSRSCDADALNDLVKLHIFWWTNSDALISELELVRMCSPNILEENNNIGDNDLFGSHLIDQVGKMMLEKIIELGSETANDNMNNNIQEWQRQVVNILSFCANIETSSESKILQFLRICNDLVSSEVIKISDIVNAINLLREPDPDSFLSQEFVDRILELFIEIPTTTERMMTSHCSFFRRCLDIISPNSPVRFHLYEILFGQEPHPLFGSVLSRVLLKDIEAESENIPLIIQNATAILRRSAHLNAINNTLKDYQLDSPIFALCCDVMQSDFFAFYSLKELVNSFQDAINILCSTNIEPLQLILAVSSLKELVSVLWKSVSIHDATREPLEFDVEEVDIDDLIENINGIMERQSFLIRSLKLYFLRDLYAKGLSLHEIKCFSKVQCRTFPWLNDLEWSDEDNRIGFVPYRFYTQYKEAEEAFAPLYARGQQTKAMDFLNKVLTDSSVHQKMSLMGTIISHLYGICALRERGPHEDTAVQFLRTQLPNMPFDNFYRETLLSFTTNTHLLYSISPETSQTELLIRSVIVHIIALHSCLSAAESPLAAYLQTLKACKNTYILTSCADADANILLEIGDALGHFTRYECECGFKYIVTECGGTQEQGICPRCKSPIGGINYNVNPGNTRIDAQAIRGNEEANAPLGYVYESIESRKDVNYRIRNMTSVSYRVLHLFVHALIAATSQEDRWDFFNNQQNQEINQEPLEYCKQHINNDWNMLTNLFNCNDETLALVLHSILTSMAENQITTIVRLNTIENRRLWEHEFTHRYITPKVNNAHGTATEFQRLVKNVQHKLESEINETLDVDDEYQNKFYPRIWRRVAETSLENLRAYCVGYQNFSTEFPLLSLFFEYEDQLPLSKNLAPIVKFARILSSKLSYRLKRKDAHTFTFAQFLSNESRPIENLKEAFENFAGAWNSVRSHITRYGCREFPTPMPEMSENLPVVYALIEMRDESLYICGAIEHLVNLQNTFLQQVLTIKPGCPSLRFLEQEQFSNNKGKNRASPSQYYIKSLSLSEARDKNIINYEWDPQLLSYSQRDLRLGHGQEIRYELCKIEAELAYSLIFDKVHLNKSNELFWLDIFSYHLELFSNSRTILSEIRELVPQETISADKPRIFENPTELLSELEVLLCFLKRTSGGDREMEITDYLNKWMKLSALTGNDQFSRMVNGLRLKHVISLYELVEEKVADVEIEFIDEKYKAKLSKQLQEEIMAGVDFEQSHGFGGSSVRKYKISHAAFTTVLKRFMFRYLSSEMYSEKEKLADYLAGETMIDCWQAWVSEEVIRENFPKSLLIANTYDAYKYTMKQIQNMNKANKSSSSSKPNESTTRARHGTSKDNGRSGRGGGRGGRGGRGGVRGGRAKEVF